MAFADKKGINLGSGFKLQAEAPIDVRFSVSTKAELNELVTLHAAYKGLIVYCEEDGISYKYNKEGQWVGIDSGEALSDKLDEYLRRNGGTMTGPIVWQGVAGTMVDVTQSNTEAGYIITASNDEGKTATDIIDPELNREIAVSSATSKSSIKVTDESVTISGGTAADTSAESNDTLKSIILGNRIAGGADFTTKNTLITMGAKNIEQKAGVKYEIGILGGYPIIKMEGSTITLGEAATLTKVADGQDKLTVYEIAATKISGELNGNAATATKLKQARTIALKGAATGTATAFDGSQNIEIPVTNIDGTKITGVIPLASIPKGAQERLVTVSSMDEMYALTTAQIQLGDVVRVHTDSKTEMFYVIDESKLNSADGYAVFSAGAASTVPVSGVEGLNGWLITQLAKADNGVTSVVATKFIGALEGNADSATKLQTARNIAISGGVTGTATAFDGTADISIKATAVSASALYVPEGDVLILDGNAV